MFILRQAQNQQFVISFKMRINVSIKQNHANIKLKKQSKV